MGWLGISWVWPVKGLLHTTYWHSSFLSDFLSSWSLLNLRSLTQPATPPWRTGRLCPRATPRDIGMTLLLCSLPSVLNSDFRSSSCHLYLFRNPRGSWKPRESGCLCPFVSRGARQAYPGILRPSLGLYIGLVWPWGNKRYDVGAWWIQHTTDAAAPFLGVEIGWNQ